MQYNYKTLIISSLSLIQFWFLNKFFDLSVYQYQLHSIVISKDLKYFFKINLNNVIAFWDYPDSIK